MFWLTNEMQFPPPQNASVEGLIAVGGDLSIERLLLAYQQGIFPWYNQNEPILWWCPDPRFVLYPSEIKVSKSMRTILKKSVFDIRFNQAFETVIINCSIAPRNGQRGTWLGDAMIDAYTRLHRMGYAHSVEAWQDGKLVGGLYGISIGKVFYGESMFSRVSNASKAALIHLAQHLHKHNFKLIDCQAKTQHLASMGARFISRTNFLEVLEQNKLEEAINPPW